jgi:hypothetical protein
MLWAATSLGAFALLLPGECLAARLPAVPSLDDGMWTVGMLVALLVGSIAVVALQRRICRSMRALVPDLAYGYRAGVMVGLVLFPIPTAFMTI